MVVRGTLYIFQMPLLGSLRSIPVAVKAERKWVEQFIPILEFAALFGGYVTWQPTERIDEALGVWGKRNVSRFRRILTEHGGEFDVVAGEGPKQHPWVLTTHSLKK